MTDVLLVAFFISSITTLFLPVLPLLPFPPLVVLFPLAILLSVTLVTPLLAVVLLSDEFPLLLSSSGIKSSLV